jgi:energy-coupling factor transport system ATP-binding protein
VRVGDWDTSQHTVAQLANRVGYVFQNPDEQLFCRSVKDEVRFGPQNLKYAPNRIEELVRRSLSLTGLSGKEDINPYDLSPTWRKMVALASILAMDTPIVILDEPTTGQDAAGVGRIASIVADLQRDGKTVVTITHDIDFCAENFKRSIVMGKGKILLDGPMQQILSQEQILRSTYVDPPQLTRLGRALGLPGTICNQDELLALEIDPARLVVPLIFEPPILPHKTTKTDAPNPQPDPNTLFPHIYGPLNRPAIIACFPLERDATGQWQMPG